jgi:hypothetical protein
MLLAYFFRLLGGSDLFADVFWLFFVFYFFTKIKKARRYDDIFDKFPFGQKLDIFSVDFQPVMAHKYH